VATALDEHEAAARRADDESRAADDAATGAMVRREEALRRVSALDQAATRWREMRAIESRIETQTGDSIRSTADAEALRSRLEASRAALRTRIDDAARRRDEVLREAAALEASRAGVPAELARLRDELDAELFAARFEDLEPSEAARVEAELGPLTHALVVADPLAAARAIAGRSREVRSVWLLSPGAVISVASDTTTAEDVVVADGPAVRVTRVPSRPVLGRRARTRRVGELRAEAERLGTEYDQAREALRSSDSLVRDVERLSFDAVSLEIGDPSEEAAVARTEAESAERDAAAARESAGEARRRAASERGRVHALRGLLADAFLLGPPDYENMAAEASARYADARRAREELERTRSARDVLGESLDALRTHPPVDDGPSPVLAGLERERSRLFEIRDRLEDVVMHKGALAFSDADRALAERTALAPALEAQLGAAREALSAAEAALGRAESARDQMTEQFQRTAAERSALDAQAAQLESELEAAVSTLGGSAPSEAALRSAEADAERLDAACRQAEQQAVVASTDAAVAHERRAEAERAAEAARALVVAEERAAEPAAERRRGIEEAATRAGVALSGWASAGGEPREAAALASEASGRSDVLLDRLVAASGGTECAERVRRGLRDRRADALESYLSAFSIVVEWIRERLPAQLGAAPDPLSALDRLRGDLVALESGLSRQEAGLRTASEDVAVGIDVQLRRAHHQVRRLNRGLDGIGFGSVAGIRVQLRRIERMDQVLRALREGAAQELLFQPTLPIEEALDEVFRRYGGGRGGGQRILDYREYVELVVEVRRREQEAWESASPSRLSTGEAIGVGAALMMVILTEWERDANLLGPRRAGGALRFLFLDEANRLSQDSLGVLFDLCKSLDLQLLIAAPEVALAEGNTTYRLVRRTTSDGREEVLVSGRRVAPSA
jgi:chromosome partition protein MukB